MSLVFSYSLESFESDRETGETSAVGDSVSLVFDHVDKVAPVPKSALTKYAVELAAPRSDHKRDEGLQVICEVTVSDHVLGEVPETGSRTRRNAWQLRSLTLDDGTEVSAWQHDERPTRVRDVIDELEALRTTATDIVVTHEEDAWPRMQVVSYSAPRFAKGDARSISIVLEQVRTAVVSTVEAPEPRASRGRRRSARGDQGTTDASEEQDGDVRRSAAASLLAALTGSDS